MGMRSFLLALSLSAASLAGHAEPPGPEEAAKWAQGAVAALGANLPPFLNPAPGRDPSLFFVRLNGGDPWSYGVVRAMRLRASPARVRSVLDDTGAYVGLFENLLAVKRSGAANPFTLFTETRIPVPFVANDRTSVLYAVTAEGERARTEFTLEQCNHLLHFGGVSLVTPVGPTETLLWRVIFLSPGFGAARILPPKTFWVENALGGLQTDLALRARAEAPVRPAAEILAESVAAAGGLKAKVGEAFIAPLSWAEFSGKIGFPKKEVSP